MLYIVVKFQVPTSNTFWDMNYFSLFSVKSRQTDRWTDRRKVMHMSPPCNVHRWAQKMTQQKQSHTHTHIHTHLDVYYTNHFGMIQTKSDNPTGDPTAGSNA